MYVCAHVCQAWVGKQLSGIRAVLPHGFRGLDSGYQPPQNGNPLILKGAAEALDRCPLSSQPQG